MKVSVWVAVASSRLISGVISGMAAMKWVVMFSPVNLAGGGLLAGRLMRDNAMMAARVTPPVMMIGVNGWSWIKNSFLGIGRHRGS